MLWLIKPTRASSNPRKRTVVSRAVGFGTDVEKAIAAAGPKAYRSSY
jgi:hypothetical protein